MTSFYLILLQTPIPRVTLGILSVPTSKVIHSNLPCILHANGSLEQMLGGRRQRDSHPSATSPAMTPVFAPFIHLGTDGLLISSHVNTLNSSVHAFCCTHLAKSHLEPNDLLSWSCTEQPSHNFQTSREFSILPAPRLDFLVTLPLTAMTISDLLHALPSLSSCSHLLLDRKIALGR